MLGKKQLAIISLLLTYTIIVPVFAYLYFYTTEPTYISAGIVLETYQTPTMQLGFYWDEACTQPITTIDYGNITHPAIETIIWKIVWIRNEGDVWHNVYFNSTLSSASTEITEWWDLTEGPHWGTNFLNGTRFDPGQLRRTWYGIKIPAYSTVGTFNWTLTLWGEHYY